MVKEIHTETSSLRTLKILCLETSTKSYVHEFGFCTSEEKGGVKKLLAQTFLAHAHLLL